MSTTYSDTSVAASTKPSPVCDIASPKPLNPSLADSNAPLKSPPNILLNASPNFSKACVAVCIGFPKYLSKASPNF